MRTLAMMPKDSPDLDPTVRDRFAKLAHCYGVRMLGVSAIFFQERIFAVNFHAFKQDIRWQICDRLAENEPNYKGLTTTQIYKAAMENKIKVHLDDFTFVSDQPIPDEYTSLAVQ